MTSPVEVRSRRFPWRPIRIVRNNLRSFLAINAAMYGLFLLGFATGLVFPNLVHAQETRLVEDGTTDLVRSLIDRPWLFALTILAVNTLKMGALTIVLPSMMVPFAGIALSAYWAFTTGITLVPSSDIGWVALVPHSLTIVIEFQAYILLLLGAYLLGKNWVRPAAAGSDTRRGGYLRGLRQLGWLALAAALLLIVGAVYEAFSLRYLLHPLAQWIL
ncbi:uncharacterized protein RMCC_3772 [Mycolicibacterium canariasense]|uniref:Stage II sporulation protein M n=1 Tax=Mycolicibacterium canariasense TaxID=228230 RepID=A0A100WEJ6_MYCCR|nr:stage II sporulation protein M [Mycolicibacterium canariasense]MCV7210613.1 stage II sporulation protein M [Mycolicibacterium canariasense]ORV05180.1 hypothetical protein AWB94_20555 [Mycolicibacterium canariasense]GAS96806.1 uncharacterized protein RMCC_3772 [Mycolicibacterium canariasense]